MSVTRYLFYISQNYSFAILRPLQEAILLLDNDVAWFVEGNAVDLNYFRDNEHRLTSIDEVIHFDPQAILYPANIAPTFLPGINVAIFHGFDAGKVDRKGHNDHFKIRNCFDLYCTQGPSTTNKFESLRKKHPHFLVKETGWCALDTLYKSTNDNANHSSQRKTILLCSTFSKRLSCAPSLFETIKKLSQSGKWNWLVQFHPKMDPNIVELYKSIESEYLSFQETDDVIPLLTQADVMVCDTSSVLIMFLLLNKPVVTFKNISPQNYMLDISDPDRLEESIETALSEPKELMHNIKDFVGKTHPYQDGESCKRVLAAIDETYLIKESLMNKPLDIFRGLKMRRKLNYWKF